VSLASADLKRKKSILLLYYTKNLVIIGIIRRRYSLFNIIFKDIIFLGTL